MNSFLRSSSEIIFGVYRAARVVKKLRQELTYGKILCWLSIVLR